MCAVLPAILRNGIRNTCLLPAGRFKGCSSATNHSQQFSLQQSGLVKDQTRHGHSPSGKRCRNQMTDTTDMTVYQLILLEALEKCFKLEVLWRSSNKNREPWTEGTAMSSRMGRHAGVIIGEWKMPQTQTEFEFWTRNEHRDCARLPQMVHPNHHSLAR